MVEGARLESEYTPKAYRGFESLPLRHRRSIGRDHHAVIGDGHAIGQRLDVIIVPGANCIGKLRPPLSQPLSVVGLAWPERGFCRGKRAHSGAAAILAAGQLLAPFLGRSRMVYPRIARLPLFFGLGRGEVRFLVCHPIDKLADRRVGQQAFHVHPVALQFRVGEVRDQRLLANGVHRHDIAPAPAFGHWMMPDDGFTGKAPT